MLEVAPAYLCDTEAGSLEPATRAPGWRRTMCSASTSVPVSAAHGGHTSTGRGGDGGGDPLDAGDDDLDAADPLLSAFTIEDAPALQALT